MTDNYVKFPKAAQLAITAEAVTSKLLRSLLDQFFQSGGTITVTPGDNTGTYSDQIIRMQIR